MKYEIGDTIVHETYGPGTVVAIDQKDLSGVSQQYYVIDVKFLKLWVPIDGENDSSMRFLTRSVQFPALFDILRMPGQLLPDSYKQRRGEIGGRVQLKTLDDLCHLIRDLKDRSRLHTLNGNDSAVLHRAEERLLDEWVLSLGVKRSTAVHELDTLLRADLA